MTLSRKFPGSIREFPVAHKPYELLLMRVFFALVVFDSVDWTRAIVAQPEPNGLAHWFDLTFFGDPQVLAKLKAAVVIPLACYAAGIAPLLSIACILFVTVGTGTLLNSQGAIDHSRQLVSLLLLAQWIAYACSAATSSRGWKRGFLFPKRWMHNAAAHLSKVMLAATYVISGVMKLVNSDGEWLARVPLLSLQITKANLGSYYNRLVEGTEFVQIRVPELILEHPHLARLFFGGGLFLELFSFLALLGRRWAFAIGVALVSMHALIGEIMSLHFDFHMLCVTVFFINLPGIVYLFRKPALTPVSPSLRQPWLYPGS